jgi:hypothetical protein
MQINNPSATFTRPADTAIYAVGDLVANSVTAGSVVPMAFALGNAFGVGQFRLTRARLVKSGTTVGASATFRLHLYENLPVLSNGDNGAWLTDNAAHWLGNIDVPTMLAFSDGAAGIGSAAAGSELLIKMFAGKTIYGLLAALGTYTPTSAETFTATLEELDAY